MSAVAAAGSVLTAAAVAPRAVSRRRRVVTSSSGGGKGAGRGAIGGARQTIATRASSAGGGGGGGDDDVASSGEDLTLQWMCLNYRPWVKSEEDARKCVAHLRDKERLEFNLEKAKEVLESVKADHQKYTPQIPFELPKVYPGFLLILQRSSDKK